MKRDSNQSTNKPTKQPKGNRQRRVKRNDRGKEEWIENFLTSQSPKRGSGKRLRCENNEPREWVWITKWMTECTYTKEIDILIDPVRRLVYRLTDRLRWPTYCTYLLLKGEKHGGLNKEEVTREKVVCPRRGESTSTLFVPSVRTWNEEAVGTLHSGQ